MMIINFVFSKDGAKLRKIIDICKFICKKMRAPDNIRQKRTKLTDCVHTRIEPLAGGAASSAALRREGKERRIWRRRGCV